MATKVLMVCLGNICRSPLAEGVMRHLTRKADFIIDSAGTANYHTGSSPDSRSIAIAAENGIDISHQQARQINQHDLDFFDHIFVMDEHNLNDVRFLCTTEKQKHKIHLLTQAAELTASFVPDPYYGEKEDFKIVYDLIYLACTSWLKKQNK